MFKSVFFDLDGVLIYTELETFNFYKEILATTGIILPDEAFRLKAGRKSQDFFRDLQDGYGFDLNFQELVELKRQKFLHEFSNYVNLAPNVKEIFKGLKEMGLKLGVTSQNEVEMVEMAVLKLGIGNLLDVTLSLKDIKNKKPDPEIYMTAIKTLNESPENCLVIEDSTDGILSAKRAGLRCLALVHEYMPKDSYALADGLIRDLNEIEKYLK